jgi:asparagine synthase (glutamine-hydrolysing)
MRRPITAFTAHFDHPDFNELPRAREFCAHVGAEIHPIAVTQDAIAAHIPDAAYHAESIFFNNQGVAKFIMSKAASELGYKVMLNGDGADEIFGGYASFLVDMLQHGSVSSGRELLDRFVGEAAVEIDGDEMAEDEKELDDVAEIIGWIPSWMLTFFWSGRALRRILRRGFRSRFENRHVLGNVFTGLGLPDRLKNREALAVPTYTWMKCMFPHYIMSYESDRVDMAHGIYARAPMLDQALVEYSCRMPASVKIRGNIQKYVLKEAVRSYITDDIYRRPKRPFAAPPGTGSGNRALRQLTQDTLRSDRFLNDVPFFDKRKTIELLDLIDTLSEEERIELDITMNIMLSLAMLQQCFSPCSG